MIRVEDEKVIINGKETLLFGGEFHYFRVPKQEWRNRIQQLKEAGLNMVSTYIPWKFHEIEEGFIDLTGETRPERDVKSFLELVQQEGMYCLVRPGPYVMAEIIDHGVPTWFIDHYPEAVAKTKDGKNHPTRVVSYMHPTFLEKARNWYETVCVVIKPFQITNGGPVLFFQLDNEVGMFHWVTNMPDYNSETLNLFKHYLREKYTPEQFLQIFQISLDELMENGSGLIKNPNEKIAHAIRNEYSLFFRNHYRDYLNELKNMAEQNGIEIPFVVNIHGFHTIDLLKRGTMYPIGISQLLEVAKINNVLMAGDYYIGNIEYDSYIDIVLANAFTKAIQWQEQPLFSAEFQGGSIHDKPRLQPTTFDLTTRLCLADGMNGVNYYMFVGGENYENIGIHGKRHDWQAPLSHTGNKRPHYHVIQHLGKMLNIYGEKLVGTKVEADLYLGFYPDYFMTEFYDVHTKAMVDEIKQDREAFLYNGMAKGLRANNLIFAAINLLDEGELNPSQIPSLWVFTTKWMDEEIQKKLAHYVESGGTLILYPTIPEYSMKNEPCSVLKDFIGVKIKGKINNGFATIGNLENVSFHKAEKYETSATPFAWTEDEERDCIAFEKEVRQGRVLVFGIGLELDFEYKKSAITDLALRAGVTSRFQLEEEIDINVRSHDDGRQFFFLNNFDEYEKKTSIIYKGETLFGGKKLVIPPRTGLMLPYHVQLEDHLHLVYGTGEIFDLVQKGDTLTVIFRAIQKEEEFLFITSEWQPLESMESVKIEKYPGNQVKVLVKTNEKKEMIHFIRRKK